MKSFLPILLLALSQVVLIQADYTVIAPSDYNSNPQIQDSLNFGGEHIIQLGVERSVLPEDEYHIAFISQIEQNLLANGVNHRFNVNILSEEGVKVDAVYAVYHRYSTGANKVVSYQYNYTFPNSLNSTQEFSWEDYDFDGDVEQPGETELPTEETEVPCEVELPIEEIEVPTEVEFPTEEEIETPIEVELPTEEEETETPTEVEFPTEEETEIPTEVEFPNEEETEIPTEVELPTEEETEVEVPTEEETEVETPIEENEEEAPIEEETEVEIPSEEEGEVPNGEDGEDGGEGEGEGEGELPDGNEEWICEEEEVVIPPPTEEEETQLPVDEWPNEWVEVCEEEQGEGEVVILLN